jgi:hypothetical protein
MTNPMRLRMPMPSVHATFVRTGNARRCASPKTTAIVRSTIGGAKRIGWRAMLESEDGNQNKSEVRVVAGLGSPRSSLEEVRSIRKRERI